MGKGLRTLSRCLFLGVSASLALTGLTAATNFYYFTTPTSMIVEE
tara:strand:- start:161 stop:295 length:135 start_codon:yes stop_codon:yes gene_type:complete